MAIKMSFTEKEELRRQPLPKKLCRWVKEFMSCFRFEWPHGQGSKDSYYPPYHINNRDVIATYPKPDPDPPESEDDNKFRTIAASARPNGVPLLKDLDDDEKEEFYQKFEKLVEARRITDTKARQDVKPGEKPTSPQSREKSNGFTKLVAAEAAVENARHDAEIKAVRQFKVAWYLSILLSELGFTSLFLGFLYAAIPLLCFAFILQLTYAKLLRKFYSLLNDHFGPLLVIITMGLCLGPMLIYAVLFFASQFVDIGWLHHIQRVALIFGGGGVIFMFTGWSLTDFILDVY
jgi:hypothetical protein